MHIVGFIISNYFYDLISIVVQLSIVVFITVVSSSVLDMYIPTFRGGVFFKLLNLTLSAK